MKGEPRGPCGPLTGRGTASCWGKARRYVVLEELSHAVERGARIYAEFVGHGRSCDAYHATDPHPEGIGYGRALDKALRQARLNPTEVDYINAHGSATPLNDPIETLAVKRVFKDHARRLAMSATKPVTGHLMGAAGAVETLICALAIWRGEIPPDDQFGGAGGGLRSGLCAGRGAGLPGAGGDKPQRGFWRALRLSGVEEHLRRPVQLFEVIRITALVAALFNVALTLMVLGTDFRLRAAPGLCVVGCFGDALEFGVYQLSYSAGEMSDEPGPFWAKVLHLGVIFIPLTIFHLSAIISGARTGGCCRCCI